MIKSSFLLKKLRIDNKEFITSEELKRYCKKLVMNYEKTIRYYVSRGYLIRIFKGIFYVKSLDEVKLGKSKYNHLELVAKGLELKGVKNWYFGLYTALKFNNLTHESFTVDYVVNDKLLRSKPINIAGYKFKFVKLNPKLTEFGIMGNNLKYSDPEKTILDFIYTWRYNGVPEEKIVLDISEWTKDLSSEKVKKYAANYPKTVQQIANMVIR
ncbi:MAG: type IV toxin-antitoxin system AbiEi family antitoxin domain-containing protein [Candidatus Bathyarchaeia archaeon]|jgi:predicted transcriptional regulator of viral defense system